MDALNAFVRLFKYRCLVAGGENTLYCKNEIQAQVGYPNVDGYVAAFSPNGYAAVVAVLCVDSAVAVVIGCCNIAARGFSTAIGRSGGDFDRMVVGGQL